MIDMLISHIHYIYNISISHIAIKFKQSLKEHLIKLTLFP